MWHRAVLPPRGKALILIASALCAGACPSAIAAPLSLESAIEQALRIHPELRAARSNVDAARARVRQVSALDPPVLSYELGKLGTRVSDDERDESIRLSQTVPLSRAAGVARIEVDIAERDVESITLRIRGDVARAYRRLQADAATLHALTGLRETAADITETTRTRLEAGTSRYLDVLRARLESARLGTDVIDARRALREDRRALNALLAREPDEDTSPSDTLAFTPLTDSVSTALARARATRPRLLAAQLAVERARRARRAAGRAFLPTLDLSFGLDRVAGAGRPGIGAGISLDVPFAPWTDRRARVQETEADARAATASLEAAERSLSSTIHDAYESARSAEEQVRTFEGSLLPDADDALRAALRSYQFGQIDGVELFETLRTYREAQVEHVRVLLAYHLSLIDLDTAE